MGRPQKQPFLLRRTLTLQLVTLLAHEARPIARAASGAAELDAKFYLRALTGKKIPPDVQTKTPRPPRTMQPQPAYSILDAVAQVTAHTLNTDLPSVLKLSDAQKPQLAIELDRTLFAGSFAQNGYDRYYNLERSFDELSIDEYEFDVRLCSLLQLFARSRPDASAVLRYSSSLGHALQKILPPTRHPQPCSAPSDILKGISVILKYLVEIGYLESFVIDDSDVDDELWARTDALSPTPFSITLNEPASLRSALWLNQVSSGRISLEPCKSLVEWYIGTCDATIDAISEVFLDGQYRENPMVTSPNHPKASNIAHPTHLRTLV